MSKERGNTLIANNKKAYHEYFIEEKFEAGIELVGTEVKSIRQGHCSIKEAFVGESKGLHHHAAQGIYQGWPCQDGDRSGKG